MSEGSSAVIDSLFLTIVIGNIFLIFFASAFGVLDNSLIPFRPAFPEYPDFSNFGFNIASIVNIGTAVGLSIQFIFISFTGFVALMVAPFQIYSMLGLVGVLIGGITAIIGSLFIFAHIRGISEALSSIVNAIGNLIPGT